MGDQLAQQLFQQAQQTSSRPGSSFPLTPTTTQSGPQPEGIPAYADVTAGSPFADAIYGLTGANMMAGIGGGNFDPSGLMLREFLPTVLERAFGTRPDLQIDQGPITRGDLALLLASLIPGQGPGTSQFSDTPGPYGAAADELAALGITAGIGNGQFGTQQNVSREQFAQLLANALAATGNPLDVPNLLPAAMQPPRPEGAFQYYTGLPNPFNVPRPQSAGPGGGPMAAFLGDASALPGAQRPGSPMVSGGGPFGPVHQPEPPGHGGGDGGHRPAGDRSPLDGTRPEGPPGSESGPGGGGQADPSPGVGSGTPGGGGYAGGGQDLGTGASGGNTGGGSTTGGGQPSGPGPGTGGSGGNTGGGSTSGGGGGTGGDPSQPGMQMIQNNSALLAQLMALMGGQGGR